MQKIDWKQHSTSWIALLFSVVGAVLLYLWQPISDYFITGAYDENILIQSESESIDIDAEYPLLVVRVHVANRGSVPIKVNPNSQEHKIELIQIEQIKNKEWINEDQGKLVATEKLFNNTNVDSIAPNSQIEIVKAIKINSGSYFVKYKLITDSGKVIKQTEFISHSLRNKLTKGKNKNA